LSEIEALVILSSIPYLGPVKIRFLINTFGSALKALDIDPKIIEEMPGFGKRISQGLHVWQDDKSWQSNLDFAKKLGVKIISYTSPNYPKNLLEIDDYPLLLYTLGELKFDDQMSIAVIGTRQASIYGLEMAEQISSNLAEKGFTIISGLARGIDTAAHLSALKKGRTIAVIGSGLGNIYPSENNKLVEAIVNQGAGAVISEFPMNTPPERQNFPRRNRIVSGMSLGTLLIEAPIKSGAMITMEKALSQKKKLFAIPGRLDNENFKGNHLLIKKNMAKLIESADDICADFETFNFRKPVEQTNIKKPLLSLDEQNLFDQMPNEEFSIDELVVHTKMAVTKLNVLLMGLMLKKAVKEYPGKIYKKMGKV